MKGMGQSEKESETVEMGELTPQQREEKKLQLTNTFGTKTSMNQVDSDFHLSSAFLLNSLAWENILDCATYSYNV